MASPGRYPFTELETGVFFFVTDSGLYYSAEVKNNPSRFRDNDLLNNGGNVFEISFDKSSEEKAFDISISETILFIIVTNILARGDISIYYFVCDTSGEKGKLRARLFNIWFLKIVKYIPLLVKVDYKIPGYDNEEFDISLLIHKNHPHFDKYIEEFGKSLDDNFNKTRLP